MTDAAQEQPQRGYRLGPLDVGGSHNRNAGWLGMWCLIVTEASLFGYLLFSYLYMELQYGRDWLPSELPAFRLSGPNTVLLLSSSVAVWWGESGIKKNRKWRCVAGLLGGIVLGTIFVVVQVFEWKDKSFVLSTDSYSSLFFTVTGFHMAHVVAGLVILAIVAFWSGLGLFDDKRHSAVSIGSVYWHFVDAVWLAVFSTLYISPHLIW